MQMISLAFGTGMGIRHRQHCFLASLVAAERWEGWNMLLIEVRSYTFDQLDYAGAR